MPKKVYFDGMNLGIKRGTGVATYTRVLANLTRGLGYSTGILYSMRHKLPKRPLEREVAFYDEGPVPPAVRIARAVSAFSNILTSPLGVTPQKVKRTGVVITRQFEATWAESDEVFALPGIFDHAQALFAGTGTAVRVWFPSMPDLFHWTYPIPMRARARANIYTIHDLVPVRLPYTTLDWKRNYIRGMRHITRRADHIVTISENSKRDIMELFGVEESRITNTYEAVDIPRAVIDRPKDLIANELEGVFGLEPGKYFLFFGSLEPKKNINRIVQAYLSANVDLPLVMIVAQNWRAEEETRLLEQVLEEDKAFAGSKERRRIRRYEYMPFRLLMTLVQGARAVLFPSLYEGFGLPVLEAMTLGTPVLTSNTSSVPELAGDACLLVDPYKVDEIRRGILSLANDTDLCVELSKRGLARAQVFSLAAYRERMNALYSRLL